MAISTQARHVNQQNLVSDIWNIADMLCGDIKQSEFGRVILPFAVLCCIKLDEPT